ncbi:PREDICTED: translation initiation factor IF-2-like [Chinchilla lanigera]|uniref:translation initiation factor IF-2-like n=1 Tax=Chinchilla lanigera TaxID=34839 RepID=UPI000697819C|nr:PREDICTED: translation initiation factor IF-2-like [Chinchilla lanigera]
MYRRFKIKELSKPPNEGFVKWLGNSLKKQLQLNKQRELEKQTETGETQPRARTAGTGAPGSGPCRARGAGLGGSGGSAAQALHGGQRGPLPAATSPPLLQFRSPPPPAAKCPRRRPAKQEVGAGARWPEPSLLRAATTGSRPSPRPRAAPRRRPRRPGPGRPRGRGAGGGMGVTPSFRRSPVTARPGRALRPAPRERTRASRGRAAPRFPPRPLPGLLSEPEPALARGAHEPCATPRSALPAAPGPETRCPRGQREA